MSIEADPMGLHNLDLPSNVYIVLFDIEMSMTRDGSRLIQKTVDTMNEWCDKVYFFYRIPIARIECSREVANSIATLNGVQFLIPPGPETNHQWSIVNGINFLAHIDILHRTGEFEGGIGGIRRGDGQGYPKIQLIDGGWAFEESNMQWPTTPSVMPVVNVSIGRESHVDRHPFFDLEPTRIAIAGASRNQLYVLAAGNWGPNKNHPTLSAWAYDPYILSVGATEDNEGKTLWHGSSVGIEGDPDTGPDLVACGITIDGQKCATSFASPKIAKCACFVAAAILELYSASLIVTEQPPTGVPLVACGIIDTFSDQIWTSTLSDRRYDNVSLKHGPRVEMEFIGSEVFSPRLNVPALPLLGPNLANLKATIALAKKHNVELEIGGGHNLDRVRQLLLDAAIPIEGYGPHQVGRGFLNQQILIEYFATFTGADLISTFSSEKMVSETLLRGARQYKIFNYQDIELLWDVISATTPVWRYDRHQRSLSWRLTHGDDVDSLSIEVEHGKLVPMAI